MILQVTVIAVADIEMTGLKCTYPIYLALSVPISIALTLTLTLSPNPNPNPTP